MTMIRSTMAGAMNRLGRAKRSPRSSLTLTSLRAARGCRSETATSRRFFKKGRTDTPSICVKEGLAEKTAWN